MTHFIWISGGFEATLLDEFKQILSGSQTTICSTQKNYRPQIVLQQLHTTQHRQSGYNFITVSRGCRKVQVNTFFFFFLPECASIGTQERSLFLKTGNLWPGSVWSASSLMMSCVPMWRLNSGMTSCLWWTASIVLRDRAEQIVNVKIKQTCPKNMTSFINTFTGEGCVGFAFSVSWFTGFGQLIFGHQVVWDSQGASADCQLKESISQLVIWHPQQEGLNTLDWKDII